MRAAAFLLLLTVPALAKPKPRPQNAALFGVVALERHGKVIAGPILEGSPAAGAGLRPGDRLDRLAGRKLWRARDLDEALAKIEPGKRVNLTYRRDDTPRDVVVRTMARSEYRGTFLQARPVGKTGFRAPPWYAFGWTNVPEGEEPPTLESTKGKVVVLLCFQCSSGDTKFRGFPVHEALAKQFAGGDVVFFHLQTVYEEEDRNTPEAGAKLAKAEGVTLPVGYDAHVDGHGKSLVMLHYGTGKCPWTVVIDKQGKVVFNGETPDFSDDLVKRIEKLR